MASINSPTDLDLDAIIKALGLLYRIGITETAISEIIATTDETERKALLDVVKRLLAHGNCVMPFNWIIEEQAKAYQCDSAGYDLESAQCPSRGGGA